MKTIVTLLTISVVLLSSCNFKSGDYDSLKEQNDSLLRAKQQMQEEIDEYFSAMNKIEQNIEKIKETQGVLEVSPESEELNDDQRTKINEDLQFLNEMLQTNKMS